MLDAHERLARAERAKAAMDEFLGPAFEAVEESYGNKLMNLAAEAPWESKRITKLASALKIAQSVRAHIEAEVSGGAIVRDQLDYARQIERIPTTKRWWLGY